MSNEYHDDPDKDNNVKDQYGKDGSKESSPKGSNVRQKAAIIYYIEERNKCHHAVQNNNNDIFTILQRNILCIGTVGSSYDNVTSNVITISQVNNERDGNQWNRGSYKKKRPCMKWRGYII